MQENLFMYKEINLCKNIDLKVAIKAIKIIAYILIFSFSVFCCSSDEVLVGDLIANNGPNEIIELFEMHYYTGCSEDWRMSSALVHRYLTTSKWVLFTVELESLSETDQSFYRSDSAYVYESSDELLGMGNVQIRTKNGNLYTNLIEWDRTSDIIHAPNKVYIQEAENEIWGSDLYTNSKMSFIELVNVSGQGNSEIKIDN